MGETTTGKGKSWMKADIVSTIQEAFIRKDHIWKKGKGIYSGNTTTGRVHRRRSHDVLKRYMKKGQRTPLPSIGETPSTAGH
jgi:hypothetical protein